MKTEPSIPISDQKRFIREFKAIRPVYVEFADLLEKILLKALEKYEYLGIVQVRAKSVASFSGKIISKDKYKDPLKEVTDLCGARVILHFQSQVADICAFIKENFEIDEANSLDLKSKLKVNEFGYRSVHYIVTPKKKEILGVAIHEKFHAMKAEIQVRTLAEHVWADISHDRIYKTELTIPEEWKREAARLSAILENADITFASMSQAIDSVSHVYDLQYENEQAETEIEKLDSMIRVQEDEPAEGVKSVLKLASIYLALDRTVEAKKLLTNWIPQLSGNPVMKATLEFELAMLGLTGPGVNMHSTEYKKEFRLAKKNLEQLYAFHLKEQKPSAGELSNLCYRFGCLLQRNHEKRAEALEFVSRAQGLMPGNPLAFTALLECIALRNLDMARRTISLFSTHIEATIAELEKLIDLGIDRITGWFSIGRCHLFLGNRNDCINAYAKAVSVILNPAYTTSWYQVDAEIDRAGRLRDFDNELADQVSLYLNLTKEAAKLQPKKEENGGKAATEIDTEVNPVLEETRIREEPMKPPVVIVAGGASRMDQEKVDDYAEYIRELMHDFRGTIISGGTTEGIPGLVGRVKSDVSGTGPLAFSLLAYLPARLPADASKSDAYDHIYETVSGSFSVMDILTCWTDIITLGINPADVILIGIDGGEIATMEYGIALSLGAKVCLVAYSGRAVSGFIREKGWKDHRNLIQVPNDPFTVWALVNQKPETRLTKEEIESLAPRVHEFYRKKRLDELKPDATDINKYKVVMEWEKLDEGLKDSNIKQVEFYELFLKRVGLAIRKADKPDLLNLKRNLEQEQYEMLARFEHARWNAERLLDGWRYGKQKDLANKINPCIVSWDELDAKTREYDYDPVDNIPLMLAKIGYEVYKTS